MCTNRPEPVSQSEQLRSQLVRCNVVFAEVQLICPVRARVCI